MTGEPGDYELIFEENTDGSQGSARLLFANFTSSLIAVNSTLLLIAAAALLGLGALAFLFYTLSQNQGGGGGGYGNQYGSGYQSYSGDGYERFRRGTEDGEEWTRVLSLLDTGTQLYTGLDQQAEQAGCRAKLACQAIETPDILGLPSPSLFKKAFQFLYAVSPTSNHISEETSACRQRYPACQMSLLSSFRQAFDARRNAELEFAQK